MEDNNEYEFEIDRFVNTTLYDFTKLILLPAAFGLALHLLDVYAWDAFDNKQYKTLTAPIPAKIVHAEHKGTIPLSQKINSCKVDKRCKKLSEVIVWESRGEPLMGMVAVGYVVMNRVNNKHFPSTIKEVVEQHKQFSYLQDWHKQKPPTQKGIDKAYIVAYDVLHSKVDDVTNGALFYHSNKIKPYWSDSKEYIVSINNHVFYKD